MKYKHTAIIIFLIAILTSCNVFKKDQEKAEEAITEYVKQHLNNPKSYESVSFTHLDKTQSKRVFGIGHTYRATNEYGAVVTTEQCFSIDSTFTQINCCYINCKP